MPSEVDEGAQVAGKASDALKNLRKTYHRTMAQHETTKVKSLQPLYDKYDQALAALQTELTKANKLDDAMRVKVTREQLASTRSGLQPPGASPVASTPSGPAPPAPGSAAGGNAKAFTNSLGMQFVPLPGTEILICIHETRRQDYAAYAADVAGVDTTWKNVRRGDIPCGHEDNHPVVGVGWEDARAYCQWLARKEGKTYRLPTDHEWSFAVGIGREEKRTKDTTPESLNQKVAGMYPWGGDYPPRTRDQAGNYSDMEWKNKFFAQSFIADYTDGFATTSPVMCFKPNKLGLYDMGGNVWEWVEDFWNAAKNEWVLRGASYANFDSMGLLSSSRHHSGSEARNDRNGFRIVLEVTD